MKIDPEYNGKWVATKGSKIIASDDTLDALEKKVAHEKQRDQIGFAPIPSRWSFIG